VWFKIEPYVIKSFAEKRFTTQFIVIGIWENESEIVVSPDKIRNVNNYDSEIQKKQSRDNFKKTNFV